MQPYIEFNEVNASPLSLTEIHISWSLRLTASNLTPYKFRVLRSEYAENGPYDLVKDNISINTNFIVDDQIKLASKLKEFTWWVEIYDPAGTFVKRSESIFIGRKYDKTALAIIEKSKLLLYNDKVGVGIDFVLHNLKSWGTRCPTCWDPVKMKMKISNCPACYGSGFENGYFNPIKMKVAMNQGHYNVQLADVTAVEVVRIGGWTLPYPTISTNDVMTDPVTKQRFRVINQSYTIKRWTVLRQLFSLTMLTKGSIEYNLPTEIGD